MPDAFQLIGLCSGVDGTVFTVDSTGGLRAWSLHYPTIQSELSDWKHSTGSQNGNQAPLSLLFDGVSKYGKGSGQGGGQGQGQGKGQGQGSGSGSGTGGGAGGGGGMGGGGMDGAVKSDELAKQEGKSRDKGKRIDKVLPFPFWKFIAILGVSSI